jgi:tRNA threonylcarbamoyladenosine modification (KEOPS) complex  Pcc1 subunit
VYNGNHDAAQGGVATKEIEMKGTEKQVQYAKAVLEGAKAWHTTKSPSAQQLDAIAFVEAIEAGDYATAEAKMDTAARWIELALEPGEVPAIKAGAVIDALKGAYYAAKANGLIAA